MQTAEEYSASSAGSGMNIEIWYLNDLHSLVSVKHQPKGTINDSRVVVYIIVKVVV